MFLIFFTSITESLRQMSDFLDKKQLHLSLKKIYSFILSHWMSLLGQRPTYLMAACFLQRKPRKSDSSAVSKWALVFIVCKGGIWGYINKCDLYKHCCALKYSDKERWPINFVVISICAVSIYS